MSIGISPILQDLSGSCKSKCLTSLSVSGTSVGVDLFQPTFPDKTSPSVI